MTTLRSLAVRAARLVNVPFARSSVNRVGCSYAVTVITPILPGQAENLRTILQSYKPREESPLAEIDYVQFARWVVIDHLLTKWRGAPRRPSTLNSEYLLFSADLTAPADKTADLPGAFFRDMATAIPQTCIDVWGKCWDFRRAVGARYLDQARFEKYLVHSLVDAGLYYAAFPNDTPGEISEALETQATLAKFAINHQDTAAQARLSAASVGSSGTAGATLKQAYIDLWTT